MHAQPKNITSKPITYRRAPAEKRQLLISAARTLFAEQGYLATSTQQIAQAAGVSEGILFHHFGSKRGLFECVAQQFAEDGARATMPAQPELMSEEAVVRGAFDFADANPALYSVLASMSPSMGDAGVNARTDIIVAAIQENLQKAMAEGQARVGDAKIMAQLQFAMVDAAYKAWLQCGDKSRREDYIQEAVRCMQAMLAPEHSSHAATA